MRLRIPTLIGLLIIASTAAQAQNLVANPGFETGDFTGWTVTGENASVESDVGRGGGFAASFGGLAPDVNVLTQTLLTQVGQQYTLTFFAQTPEFNIPPGSPNSLTVSFSGAIVDGPLTVPDNPTYQQFRYTVTADSTSTELRFEISNDPDFTQLDDISVIAVSAAAPEPSALAFVLTGIGIARLVRRRR